MILRRTLLALGCLVALGGPAAGQSPTASPPPPDDTPSIRVGTVIYADWSVQPSPKIVDADGNSISPNTFNITRGYINVTGNISHLVAFRVTPDVARETSPTSSLSGALELRIKYAYAQVNFDDWMTKGSFARLGIQQTPWVDFAEGLYRYRFQGTMFAEREGYLSSADAGASFRYQLPRDYGDVHVGVYNGEGYQRSEINDQKAIMIRGTARPFVRAASMLRGVRASVFYDDDHYVKNAERTRLIAAVNIEHPYVNAGAEFLRIHDQQSAIRPGLLANVKGTGYSLWATPRSRIGWEGLLRFDHLEPDATVDATQSRAIVGVAYWFPHQGSVASALMLDYDGQTFANVRPARPKQSKLAVHGLISF